MKWGTLYPAEYVNVLYSAVKKNLAGPFRFVCLTDDATGFEEGIESFPIPDIGLDEWHYYHGAWPKLSVFSDDLYGLTGRCLFIDLDTVVLNRLDDLFDIQGALVALDSAPWRFRNAAPRTMSSIFAFDIGKLGWLVENIRAKRDALVAKYGIEQDYLHGEVPNITYWPQEWIVSYKYHIRPPLLIDRFRGPKKPKGAARLVAFHGNPRPIDLIRPPKGNWDVFPHHGSGPVRWMQDYWCANGGSLKNH
tara:strand:+ start:828 stop:1574 length:747 start_codon:yes stop_codon:yes gene_type:complete